MSRSHHYTVVIIMSVLLLILLVTGCQRVRATEEPALQDPVVQLIQPDPNSVWVSRYGTGQQSVMAYNVALMRDVLVKVSARVRATEVACGLVKDEESGSVKE